MNKLSRHCKGCKKYFLPKYSYQLYCTTECRDKQYVNFGSGLSLATGTVGAIAELGVSADLMRKGFEVYRALSPSSSCDLLVLKNGKVITIEVRSAFSNSNGIIHSPMRNIKAEVLAQFLHRENRIIYTPPLE
jgi:hypothetical protein